VKTSVTHPLQIAAVPTSNGIGRIGITFCPGKFDPCGSTGAWARDLELDLTAIKDWGATALLTLIEDWELKKLLVEHLGTVARQLGLEWFHLPIVDGAVPEEKFENEWKATGPKLMSLLLAGRDIVVHCKGGQGRAGTIAARLLVDIGIAPREAMARVRKSRDGAIENPAQERYILGLVKAAR
jgi:ADP-ribosyl-[dinitrogen reductase] hydrolase